MRNYNELKVWQKAHQMVLHIYETTKFLPKEELYGLTSQLRRAAVSIPANLAEGCGKNSKPDTVNFFQIALGSLHETEYYILLIKDLSYIRTEKYLDFDGNIKEVKAMLVALIKSIRTSN